MKPTWLLSLDKLRQSVAALETLVGLKISSGVGTLLVDAVSYIDAQRVVANLGNGAFIYNIHPYGNARPVSPLDVTCMRRLLEIALEETPVTGPAIKLEIT